MNAILDMKAPLSAGPFLKISNNLGDVADAATSRTNLGLIAGGAGDIWVEKAGDIMSGALTVQGILTMASELQHEGDTDTKIGLDTNKQTYTVGGLVALQLTNTTQNLVEIGDVGGAGDVDIDFNDGQMFLRGSDGFFSVGTSSPSRKYHLLATSGSVGMRFEASEAATDRYAFFELFAYDGATSANLGEIGVASDGSSGVFDGNLYILARNDDIVFLTGAGSVEHMRVNQGSGGVDMAKHVQFTEMTAPGAGAANTARLYIEDNGAGKTRLMAIFNTGAAQQIAIEP